VRYAYIYKSNLLRLGLEDNIIYPKVKQKKASLQKTARQDMLRRATPQPFNSEAAFDFSLIMESLRHESVTIYKNRI